MNKLLRGCGLTSMSQGLIRLILIGNWVVIQLVWVVTNRGKNIKTFLLTFRNFRPDLIYIFETLSFLQLLLPYSTSISLGAWNKPIEVFGSILALIGAAFTSWAKITMGKTGVDQPNTIQMINPLW